jgi:hypothetical protein
MLELIFRLCCIFTKQRSRYRSNFQLLIAYLQHISTINLSISDLKKVIYKSVKGLLIDSGLSTFSPRRATISQLIKEGGGAFYQYFWSKPLCTMFEFVDINNI